MGRRRLKAEFAAGMYETFAQLDGSHPWRQVSPQGYQDYQARYRPGGRVVYFNYPLAAELGLIPRDHPPRMNRRLEKVILDTFALQIINEYDLAHPRIWAGAKLKPGRYMATRYLQLQHNSRQGLTSGDGRAVWNGCIRTGSMTFDVSSRGTGVTCLCPGAQISRQPLKTGCDVGYGTGTADLDEMLGTAVMSEIFYRQGYPTERTLAVIDFGDGTSIGVRTAPNLLRPAHLFRYLRQGRRCELRASFDFFLNRQESNGFWKLPKRPGPRYRKTLQYLARSYGQMAALLEEEYIFTWLAWDGDNVLASGAILDYGSVRQFAAKHDKYRYDDVNRWSTCLTEQRYWARQLVKVFAQGARFALTGRSDNLRRFDDAPCLRTYDRAFRRERDRRLLWRLGFTPQQSERLVKVAKREIADLRRALVFFEDLKVEAGIEELADGVTHRPVFLIRNLLRRLPEFYLKKCGGRRGEFMPAHRFCRIMAASYVSSVDVRMTKTREARARNFQACYQRLIAKAGRFRQVLQSVCRRSAVINFEHRITGDAIIHIVNHVIDHKRHLDRNELQSAIERFIESQVLIPGEWRPIEKHELKRSTRKSALLRRVCKELEECKETV
jgi:hypothetical protein